MRQDSNVYQNMSVLSLSVCFMEKVELDLEFHGYPIAVADPGGGGGGGVRGFIPPFRGWWGFFCLSVYENFHGPGP